MQRITGLIKMGVTEFYSGGMGRFDKMCERIVKAMGGKIIYIPYNRKCIKMMDKAWYDDIFCPLGDKEYEKYDIPDRNKWMVENADIALCYVYKDGGAFKTMNYALKLNKRIIRIQKSPS